MKTFTKCFCLAIFAGLLGGSASAQTASTNSAPTIMAPKAKSKAISGVVASVDNDAKTITLKDHDKPFAVTSKTRISKDGQPATLSDIMAGDDVRLRAKDDESGNPTATSIRVGKVNAKAAAAAAPSTNAPADSK